ncbi:unnamed protein product [Ectocarpus fasciculatus]
MRENFFGSFFSRREARKFVWALLVFGPKQRLEARYFQQRVQIRRICWHERRQESTENRKNKQKTAHTHGGGVLAQYTPTVPLFGGGVGVGASGRRMFGCCLTSRSTSSP